MRRREPSTTVPPTLKIKGSFLIRVESKLAYAPVITWACGQQGAARPDGGLRRHLDMAETYYLRPRMSHDVKCDDC